MLKEDWYIEPPIDFEHKHYVLLQYLSSVDDSYSKLILSPYLLKTENIIKSMSHFKDEWIKNKKILRSEVIGFNIVDGLIRKDIDSDELKEIIEIVDYSIPMLSSKVKLGYKLLKKYPQVLWIS